MNVLIADDNVTNLKLLHAQLESEGLTVFAAANGEEALAVLARESIDAIISDILMPHMDGYRFCYEVRHSDRWNLLPFVFYTASYTSPSDEKLAVDVGADKFIRKPASVKMLLDTLQSLAREDKYHQPRPIRSLPERDVMNQYSERLVAKLEQKNGELEQRTAELSKVNAALQNEIAERKQAEAALRESERRFSGILGNVELVSLMLDDKARITYSNDYLHNLTGWRRDELLGGDWFERFVPPESSGSLRQIFALLLADQPSAWHHENEILTRSGARRMIRWSNSALRSPSGVVVGCACIGEDITDRQRSERLALRSQRLEAIGTLAGGVAHDLNNALAPIMMGAEMLRMQYPNDSEIVDLFYNSAKRGAGMVRQLLSFAKGAEGERVLIQPSHLVKEIRTLMQGSFPKNIIVNVACPSELPTVLGDATQLHQVLLNLCVNARDAMPEGGALTVEAQVVEVDDAYARSIADARPGHYVLLRVRDTGTGIPPEILDRIFDPFFTTKGPEAGTGLGLSTVMGIVKGHGGFLHVYSQVGKGSTFGVYLPVNRTETKIEFPAAVEQQFHGHGEAILLVDDEPAVREMARAVLRRLHCTPLTASGSADALIQAAEHRAELRAIITDLHMPQTDGLGFVRSLRQILPDIPIAVSSGRMDEAEVQKFRALKVTQRLDKPFTEVQLAETLRRLLAPSK